MEKGETEVPPQEVDTAEEDDIENMSLEKLKALKVRMDHDEERTQLIRFFKARKVQAQQADGTAAPAPPTLDEKQHVSGHRADLKQSLDHFRGQWKDRARRVCVADAGQTWELVNILQRMRHAANACVDAQDMCGKWLAPFWTDDCMT